MLPKHLLLLVITTFILGLLAGLYFGYEIGFSAAS
jgi:hypothetical protein